MRACRLVTLLLDQYSLRQAYQFPTLLLMHLTQNESAYLSTILDPTVGGQTQGPQLPRNLRTTTLFVFVPPATRSNAQDLNLPDLSYISFPGQAFIAACHSTAQTALEAHARLCTRPICGQYSIMLYSIRKYTATARLTYYKECVGG